ncbi:hypothetical protein [Streptomyces sp. IB2014 016-6]|uniref:hypothetical protein n=1 Tax=Streptomyces sp. IB2014 016-6 TaxID=2517818 RepID=UPI0011CAE473|nr:hypothetical protein [Streptomyces sp. IB2014 016-6]TXL84186.1 hypothetical protein EW053_35095 [Streptomyces sp. IB2014 016-6]
MLPSHITLSYSRTSGIVAVAHGEEYQWAQTALAACTFRRHENGLWVLPAADLDTARRAVNALFSVAERHRTTIAASSRAFLHDVAKDLAAQLGDGWTAELEIYSHPVWQEDLVPWLWDASELSHAVQNTRIPCAARLHNGDITLLMVERPGHDHGYVLGAFAPEPFDDNYDEPHAPTAVVVPAATGLAARIVEGRFLPAYQHALHQRRLTTVTQALDRIHEEHQILTMIRDSGRYTDAAPLDPQALPRLEHDFAEHAWLSFTHVLTHAPALLERCFTTTVPGSDDANTVTRLREALTDSRPAFDEWHQRLNDLVHTPAALRSESREEARSRLATQVMPAIETWLDHGAAFARIAQAATCRAGGPSPRPYARSRPARSPRTAAAERPRPAPLTSGRPYDARLFFPSVPGRKVPLRLWIHPSTSSSAPTPTTASSPRPTPPPLCPRTSPTGS